LPNVLGALGQAKRRGLGRLQHLSGPADQLAGDQKRQQHIGDPGELAGPHDQVVLVAAVGVARRVGVVLEQVDVAANALSASRCSASTSRSSSTHSPARSWVTSCTRLSHSAVAYSGWLPTSRYRRAPLRKNTLELRPHDTTRRN